MGPGAARVFFWIKWKPLRSKTLDTWPDSTGPTLIDGNVVSDWYYNNISDILETKSVYFAHLFPMAQKKSLGFILTFKIWKWLNTHELLTLYQTLTWFSG